MQGHKRRTASTVAIEVAAIVAEFRPIVAELRPVRVIGLEPLGGALASGTASAAHRFELLGSVNPVAVLVGLIPAVASCTAPAHVVEGADG